MSLPTCAGPGFEAKSPAERRNSVALVTRDEGAKQAMSRKAHLIVRKQSTREPSCRLGLEEKPWAIKQVEVEDFWSGFADCYLERDLEQPPRQAYSRFLHPGAEKNDGLLTRFSPTFQISTRVFTELPSSSS